MEEGKKSTNEFSSAETETTNQIKTNKFKDVTNNKLLINFK